MKNKDDWGLVPLLVVSALVTLWFVWAALHDISQAKQAGYALEYSVLVLSALAFPLIHRKALGILRPRGR